ncbi:hypothetical protein ROZALSC1DRAFT_31977 [Rozella allomycis CSF55]|uniref:Uncharacterized protein n=1 Tax=Rozella allomycis (strain CSF55) TaxID=988480 RepID=A0A075AUD9_ROZAC|nr:hypothetical protein O9G_006179 [Rozella allomycis CSF55]RKP15768.1 hypothetical protein ROZALSC1DRAFT_31977 [Rozella allomycis CSF55]|eukprot:EPZ33883.1 hypothetical protein O9G_006179 [Rozella allomycis CSF55]
MMSKERLLNWVETNCLDEALKESIKTFIWKAPFDSLMKLTEAQWAKKGFDIWGEFIFNELHPESKYQSLNK